MSRVVLTYGTFDLLHVGHLQLLKRARELGDKLIVGVSSDSFNAVKGKSCVVPFAERALLVSSLRCVDQVFGEDNWDQKIEDIRRFGASVFVMGDDWLGKFDYLEDYGVQVCYLPRTPDVSSTARKEFICASSRKE